MSTVCSAGLESGLAVVSHARGVVTEAAHATGNVDLRDISLRRDCEADGHEGHRDHEVLAQRGHRPAMRVFVGVTHPRKTVLLRDCERSTAMRAAAHIDLRVAGLRH